MRLKPRAQQQSPRHASKSTWANDGGAHAAGIKTTKPKRSCQERAAGLPPAVETGTRIKHVCVRTFLAHDRWHFCSASNMSFASDKENRRHKRLVKRASKLDVADLLEIAAMKGLRPREVHDDNPSAGEESGDEAEPAPADATTTVKRSEWTWLSIPLPPRRSPRPFPTLRRQRKAALAPARTGPAAAAADQSQRLPPRSL